MDLPPLTYLIVDSMVATTTSFEVGRHETLGFLYALTVERGC